MSEIRFVCRGKVVPADGLPMVLSDLKAKPKAKGPTEAKHYGFIVEGYKPREVDDAKKSAEMGCSLWSQMDDESRRLAIRDGKREPKPWDLTDWMRRHKKSRVSKPFSMPESANVAKQMAVEVRELVRGATA